MKEKVFNFSKAKEERGSITIYVLSALLVLVLVIIATYLGVMNKTSSQAKQLEKIQSEYTQSENEMTEKYDQAK